MGETKRKMAGADALRKPGWLPTAVIVNILPPNSSRNGKKIATSDLVRIEDDDDIAKLYMPKSFTGTEWEPDAVFPLEVIDGQHLLWAFEDFDPGDEFELPVVAFYGLDRSWQAYVFWSVNITPKKINRSLAFDLYPLLRQEDWLDLNAGHSIYRETRCQELIESLWSHPDSPWHKRINMLGKTAKQLGSDVPMVTQAAWIRSLMASFVKENTEDSSRIGGLFGAGRFSDELTLPWNRAMQVAFLIFAGRSVRAAVRASKAHWARHLRSLEESRLFIDGHDFAFYGKYSLFAVDQGIRGLLQTINDLCCTAAKDLELDEWDWETVYSKRNATGFAATDERAVVLALDSLRQTKIGTFLKSLGQALSSYDWRTSSTPELTEKERLKQSAFRGSSGYKEIRHQLLMHVAKRSGSLGNAAKKVIYTLKAKPASNVERGRMRCQGSAR